MAKKYYTLLERAPGEIWAPQFGDYDREVVQQEMADMKDSGTFVKGTKFKIIASSAFQNDINRKVAILNYDIRNETRCSNSPRANSEA